MREVTWATTPAALSPRAFPCQFIRSWGRGRKGGAGRGEQKRRSERRGSEGGEPHLDVREVFPLEGLGDEAGGLVLGDGLVNEEKAGEEEKKEE